MLKEISINNSNSLAICDKNQIANDFYMLKKHPDVVMLSAWSIDSATEDEVKPLIEKLLQSGCKYFVCVGEFSEQLHDFIDDLILERFISKGSDDDGEYIMTTWHDAETDEEVANFFLHSTNVSGSLLVAILDKGVKQDSRLKNTLLSVVHT